MDIQNKRIPDSEFHALRNEVLTQWPTGKDVDLEEAVAYHKAMPECRDFSKKLLDANGEFTVNIPVGACDKNILAVCGKESGRDVTKIEKLGLTLIPGETVSVPAIKELPLTLECKVIYQQDQDLNALDSADRNRCYPLGTVEENNFHTAYYGEIVSAYIIKP